jgi:hypothetical protein
MLAHHVKHYLSFLGETTNTFSWMDGSSSEIIPGRSCVYGKFKNVIKWYEELKSDGLPTLHVTLNETDLSGSRRTPNIKAYRVLCCDLDREITEEELLEIHEKYHVQMVVRSSPGKYHLYWRLERGADLEVWRQLQLGIAHELDGDLQLSLPTSMIRVPGFPRLGKDGKKVLPAIMAFKSDNPVRELSVREIVQMWPWIWEEAAAGEKELKKQRSDAAKVAKELMRARGTEYDAEKFARRTPKVGRNITLYHTTYEIVYANEDKVTFEEALSYGTEINEAFQEPLGRGEVEATVRSAWSRAKRGRKLKIREQRKLVETLDKNTEKTTREGQKELKKSVGELIVSSLVPDSHAVPDSYLEISDILYKRIWEDAGKKDKRLNYNVLASAASTRYYQKLNEFLVEELKSCGAFKVNGYSVYLKGVNEAGRVVRYRKVLDEDSLSSLLQNVLEKLYLQAFKYSLNGSSKGEKGDMVSHLEGVENGKGKRKGKTKKKKESKGKAKGSTKVHRNKADSRGDSAENAP